MKEDIFSLLCRDKSEAFCSVEKLYRPLIHIYPFINLQTKNPSQRLSGRGRFSSRKLYFRDVSCLETLGAFLHVEFDFVAFVQGLIAFTDYRLEMDEHIFAILP